MPPRPSASVAGLAIPAEGELRLEEPGPAGEGAQQREGRATERRNGSSGNGRSGGEREVRSGDRGARHSAIDEECASGGSRSRDRYIAVGAASPCDLVGAVDCVASGFE